MTLPTYVPHRRSVERGADLPPATVADRMTSPPITVPSDAPIGIVSALLDRHAITGLPVVDPTGGLVGVISEVDVARLPADLASPSISTPRELLVRHVMSAPAVTVRPSTAIALAVRRMERHHVRRLVVVAEDDDLRPIGVVTAGDLVPTANTSQTRGASDA